MRVPGTSLAIVIAGGLIGLGLYFGLQRRSAPEPGPAAEAPREAPTSPDAATQKARLELAAWLEAQRPVFVSRCWAPSAALTADPPRASYVFNLAVDEGGREVARGISESRGAFRSDVGACLRSLREPVAISPPGVPINVELPITLPQ